MSSTSIFGAASLDPGSDGPIDVLLASIVAAAPSSAQTPPVTTISVALTSVEERSVVASRAIEAGEVVLSLPSACFLGPTDIAPSASAAIDADTACSDPLMLRMILLLYECKICHDGGDGDGVFPKGPLKAQFYATLQYDLSHMPVYFDEEVLDLFGPRWGNTAPHHRTNTTRRPGYHGAASRSRRWRAR
jgi:hypothetical protein